MHYLSKKRVYEFVYDYFKNIEFAYDTLKAINGKTINQLTTDQYDYLHNCESWSRKIDTANNTRTERFIFLKGDGRLMCWCLEVLGVCTMLLSYESIYIELTGPSDDMDKAVLKCNLLNINDYVQEMKEILLSIGFIL